MDVAVLAGELPALHVASSFLFGWVTHVVLLFAQAHVPTVDALSHGDVIRSHVNPGDLDGVIAALKAGYGVDWDQQREYWAMHPITNPDSFTRLLSVWRPALDVRAMQHSRGDSVARVLLRVSG